MVTATITVLWVPSEWKQHRWSTPKMHHFHWVLCYCCQCTENVTAKVTPQITYLAVNLSLLGGPWCQECGKETFRNGSHQPEEAWVGLLIVLRGHDLAPVLLVGQLPGRSEAGTFAMAGERNYAAVVHGMSNILCTMKGEANATVVCVCERSRSSSNSCWTLVWRNVPYKMCETFQLMLQCSLLISSPCGCDDRFYNGVNNTAVALHVVKVDFEPWGNEKLRSCRICLPRENWPPRKTPRRTEQPPS